MAGLGRPHGTSRLDFASSSLTGSACKVPWTAFTRGQPGCRYRFALGCPSADREVFFSRRRSRSSAIARAGLPVPGFR